MHQAFGPRLQVTTLLQRALEAHSEFGAQDLCETENNTFKQG
jgi:hypothetical protein